MTNRLHLDFSLTTMEERTSFLNANLPSQLTPDECETCANYILWGTGSPGDYVLESAWSGKNPEESLEALLEEPTFSEESLRPLSSPVTRITKEKFSRTAALEQCPSDLVPIFTDLFRQIDQLDLVINYYEYQHGKRSEEPRAELLARFTADEQLAAASRASHLTQYTYLKMRHELIELRRQQYTYRDSYVNKVERVTPPHYIQIDPAEFDSEIPVYPLGVFGNQKLQRLLYQTSLVPDNFGEEELRAISHFYWEKQEPRPRLYFDFENAEHIYQLFAQFFDMRDAGAESLSESNTSALVKTLQYYTDQAELPPLQADILEMKLRKVPNQDIATDINQRYGKTYSANYISTIFCQKIVPAICNAARLHREFVANLAFPENWKRCSACGRTLLVGDDFFVKKARSKDGYSNRCKRCDKLERERKKNYVPKFTTGDTYQKR